MKPSSNTFVPRTIATRAYTKALRQIMSTHETTENNADVSHKQPSVGTSSGTTTDNPATLTDSIFHRLTSDQEMVNPNEEENLQNTRNRTHSRTSSVGSNMSLSGNANDTTLQTRLQNLEDIPTLPLPPSDTFPRSQPNNLPPLHTEDNPEPHRSQEQPSRRNRQNPMEVNNPHSPHSFQSYSSHPRPNTQTNVPQNSPNNPYGDQSMPFSQIILQQSQQIQQLLQMMPALLNNRNVSPNPSHASILPTFSLPPLDQLMPQFHGKDDDNPLEFITKFKSTLHTYNIPMDTWKAVMRNQLQQSARSWFDRNSTRFTSFEIFSDLFVQQYNNNTVQTRLKAQFYSNQQSFSESSVNFINAKLKAHRRLFPSQSENDAIEDLIQLLHPQVQVHLLQTPPTIDDLLLKLEIIDKARRVDGEKPKGFSKAENSKPFSNTEQKSTFHRSAATSNEPNDHKISPSYPNFVPNCRYCPERHFHRDCPTLKRYANKQTTSPNNNTPPPNNQPAKPNNPPFQSKFKPTGFPPANSKFPPFQPPQPSKQPNNNKPPHVSQVGELHVSPSICIKLFDRYQPVMLDSGASECYIERRALPPDTPIYPCHDNDVMTGSGQTVQVIGLTPLTFTLGKREYQEDFRVIEELSVPILIGVAWFKKHKAIIDFARSMLIIGNSERENLPFLQRTLDQMKQIPTINLEEVHHGFPEEYVNFFHSLLIEYADVFDTTILQQTTATEHHIPLTTNKPVYVHPYRLSPQKQEFVKHQVQDMLTQNLIETSDSPYCSPIVVIEYPNQDKEPRFCIDYRKLNEITVDQNCPSVNIHELVRNIGDYKIFCTIDLKKGYWQVPLAQESRPYSAFSTPSGEHYQFKVMPFGLKGAPGTFIRMMGKVLQDLVGKIVEVYLDDLIIKAQTWDEMLLNLRIVLERLRLYQLTASLSKCQFGRTEIQYLGHIITSEHNSAPTAHITAIQQSSPPRTKKQMLSFLGTCNWLREYLPHASEVMAPLYKTTSRKPFKWHDADNEAFDKVKEAFTKLEPLHRPKADLPYVLQTDASKIGLGATLYQQDGEQKRIIANISATLNDAETRYSSNEKECLAVLWAIKKFRPYLEGQKFLLRTDNRALLWLDKFKEERSKLTRWALTLQEYNFSVEHVPGTQNLLPDILSRNPVPETYADSISSDLFPPLPEREDIPSLRQAHVNALHSHSSPLLSQVKAAQRKDDFCNESTIYYDYLLMVHEQDLHPEDKSFLQKYQVINGYLYARTPGSDEWSLYVPQSCTETVIKHYHTDPLYCHPGIAATTTLIRQTYYWPKLHQDVCQFIQLCETCARTKVAGKIKAHPYKARITPQKHHTWSVDLMGPYPVSSKGNQYLIVVTDICSKWVEAKPIRQATTSAITRFLEDEVFARFGYPHTILSDNGPQFTSKEWKLACEQWNASHFTTASYSPWQNQVERRNQSIKDKLRIQLLDKPHKRWDQDIPKILYSLRNSVNQATGKSPAEIYFNQRLRHPKEQSTSSSTYNESIVSPTLFSHHRHAIENQRKYVKRYENKKKPPVLHRVDSIIFIRNHEQSRATEGFAAALAPKWIGPFKILHVYPSGVYKCASLNNPQDIRKVSHRDTQFRYYTAFPRTEQAFYYNRHDQQQPVPDLVDNAASQRTDYLRFSSSTSDNSQRDPPSFHPPRERDERNEDPMNLRNSTRSHSSFNGRRPKRNRKPNPKYLGELWDN